MTNLLTKTFSETLDYVASVNALDVVLRRWQWFRDHQQLPQADYELAMLARCGMDTTEND